MLLAHFDWSHQKFHLMILTTAKNTGKRCQGRSELILDPIMISKQKFESKCVKQLTKAQGDMNMQNFMKVRQIAYTHRHIFDETERV